MDANNVTPLVASTSKDAMERELNESWARVANAMTAAEPDMLAMMQKAYWYGVTTGVAVFNKAIDGAYR